MNENEQTNQETTETTQTTTTPVAADALSPVAAGNQQTQTQPSGDAQRIAELERELQQERVEKGRLRQTNDELRSAKEEIARLKAENARLAQRKPSDYLTDEERAELDDKQLAAIDKVVQGRVGDMSAAQKAENDRLREEIARRDANIAASAKAQFNAEVERLAPGLAAVVNEHAAEWQKWAASPRRAASVAAAFQQNDAATVAEFLQEFVQSKGIQANGDGIAARPRTSFSPTGGSHPVQTDERDTATYTVDQYGEALRRAGEDLTAGRITSEQYRAIKQKFTTALNEGRIVPR